MFSTAVLDSRNECTESRNHFVEAVRSLDFFFLGRWLMFYIFNDHAFYVIGFLFSVTVDQITFLIEYPMHVWTTLKKWNDVMFSYRETSKTMHLYDMKDLQAQASNW